MKCNLSNQLITICMALLCIMSSLSLKINFDEKIESKVSKSLEKTSEGPDYIYYAVDYYVCGLSIKYKGKTTYTPIPFKANAPYGVDQTLDVSLKPGDEIRICVDNRFGMRNTSSDLPMFVCTIKYKTENRKHDILVNTSQDDFWKANGDKPQKMASVVDPKTWGDFKFNNIDKNADLIWDKKNSDRVWFFIILPNLTN